MVTPGHSPILKEERERPALVKGKTMTLPLYDATITLHIRAANKVEARAILAKVEESILQLDETPEQVERVYVEWQVEEIEPGTPAPEPGMYGGYGGGLTDSGARYIASQWASGGDDYQVFASTGRIPDGLLKVIETDAGLAALQFDGEEIAGDLRALGDYVRQFGPRDAVEGWGDLPECTEERESRQVWEEQDRNYNSIVAEGLGLR